MNLLICRETVIAAVIGVLTDEHFNPMDYEPAYNIGTRVADALELCEEEAPDEAPDPGGSVSGFVLPTRQHPTPEARVHPDTGGN